MLEIESSSNVSLLVPSKFHFDVLMPTPRAPNITCANTSSKLQILLRRPLNNISSYPKFTSRAGVLYNVANRDQGKMKIECFCIYFSSMLYDNLFLFFPSIYNHLKPFLKIQPLFILTPRLLNFRIFPTPLFIRTPRLFDT